MLYENIQPGTLHQWLGENRDFQLVDIREQFERDICHIGGTHIPLGQIGHRIQELRTDIPVVLYCHHGNRSSYACEVLSMGAGFKNLVNLMGGIDAWARKIDTTMAKY